MQESMHSGLEQFDRSKVMELEGDSRPDLSGLDESAEVHAEAMSGDMKLESTTLEAPQTSGPDDAYSSAGAANEAEEVHNEDRLSRSAQLLLVSDVSPELMIQERENEMAGSSGEMKTEGTTHEAEQISGPSAGATNEAEEVQNEDGLSLSAQYLPTSGASPELMIQERENEMVGSLGEMNTEGTTHEAKQISGPSAGATNEAEEVQNTDDLSLSVQSLAPSDLSSEPTIQERELVAVTSSEVSKTPSVPSDSTNMNNMGISEAGVSSISLSDLAEVVRGLGEDDFQFLLMLRKSENGFSDVCERLNEQLCLTKISEHMLRLQIAGQLELQTESDRLISMANASLNEVRGKNESLADELQQLYLLKADCEELSARLERSQQELSNVSTELGDCKGMVADLQVQNENLNGNLISMTKERGKLEEELTECRASLESLHRENVNLKDERTKLEEEKQYYVHENDKILTDLADCKGLMETLLAENAKLDGITEERKRLEKEKEFYANEIKKVSIELTGSKGLVETLQMEILNLNKSLALVTDEKDFFASENEKQTRELVDYKGLMEGLEVKYYKAVDDLREASIHVEQLTEENMSLVCSLGIYEATLREFDGWRVKLSHQFEEAGKQNGDSNVPRTNQDRLIDDDDHRIHGEGESINFFPVLDVYDDSLGFISLKVHLEQAEEVMQKLEKSIVEMYSHSGSLGSSSGKVVAPAVSKLIQAFESKTHVDDTELHEAPVTEIRSPNDPYILTKEQTRNLRLVLKELCLDAEKACELFKGERDGKMISDIAFSELVVRYETLKKQCDDLEEANIECVVLYEILKQYVCTAESTNSELLGLYESSSQQNITLQTENTDLEIKLSSYQRQLDELQQSSDDMVSSTNSQMAVLQEDMTKKLDAATKVIDDLQEKLESAHRDHESMYSSYKEVDEKFNDLNGKNELATAILRKIYDNLWKLVNEEETETDIQTEKLLDPLHFGNYDILVEQLKKLLGERLNLKSELMDRTKDIEEMSKRCLGSDVIMKLVDGVKGANFDTNEPSFLESSVYFLIEKCKEVDERISLSSEELGSKELKMNELQEQNGQLSFLIVQRENEIDILEENLRKAMEDLVAVRSEVQEKVTELEQSEQRVSSLREKLGIAVTKGKALLAQRDGLKQSIAEKSSELESCLQELQLKDSMIHDVQTKLKTYSEAGERVEALETELSYIRNSATALRESFLLKDSAIQRIEEILEDLELPEHFHARDIIEKVDWLARSVTGNSIPPTDWDQRSSSDAGFVAMDGWKEDSQSNSNSNPGDDLRRKCEELQSRLYGLAEQNEMLEQSLMERNNLVQRWEEVLEKINTPLNLRSMEPEDRIEWLGGALTESVNHCDSLQEKLDNMESYCGSLTADIEESQKRISDLEAALQSLTESVNHCDSLQEKLDNMESYCGSLTADIEESKKRISDLETALQSVTSEKEHLSGSFDTLVLDFDKVSEKAALFEVKNGELQNEVTALKESLDKKLGVEEHIHQVEGEIRRLEGIINDALQESTDMVLGTSSTECLELSLRKLIDKYQNLSVAKIDNATRDAGVDDEVDIEALKKELDTYIHNNQSLVLEVEVLNVKVQELQALLNQEEQKSASYKEERDTYMNSNQSLVREVEALTTKRQELHDLLTQEEQKSASIREKLNLAVRKGKSLVQQRDGMRQTIDEATAEVERLKSDIKLRENTLSEYEQKIEGVESESLFLRNRLTETERDLQEKGNVLSMILSALGDIVVDFDSNISDPVEKLVQIGEICRDLRASANYSEQESRKSKKAAELLLAELNEVQERNDVLQEELEKTSDELVELSKERDSANSDKLEALSRLENLSGAHSQERDTQFAEFMMLKSGVDKLRKDFFDINSLLGDVFSWDMTFMQSLKASLSSSLGSSDITYVASLTPGGAHANSNNKENLLPSETFLDAKMQEQFNDNSVGEICKFVGNNLQYFTSEIVALKDKLHKHSFSVHEEANLVSELVENLQKVLIAYKQSVESTKADLIRLESIGKEKETENLVMRRSISLLYDACKNSIMEIGNRKASVGDERLNLDSEESVRVMADRLLSVVKDFITSQTDTVEASQMEMKTTISNLQKELHEKDIQRERICVQLVNQIKESEANATSYLQELQPAKARNQDLERQLSVKEEEVSNLARRVNELQPLTDVLAAKEQEIEALMQALDEEEAQMEDMRNKIKELEKVLQQKNLDLDNTEASRGKAMKKLSITVSKFDELHNLSENLLFEIEKLQSQLQDRDSEISFLRQEVTRCTNDALVASQMSDKRNSDEIHDLVTWLNSMVDRVQVDGVYFDDEKNEDQVNRYKEVLQKQIMAIVSALEDLRGEARSRDNLLQLERTKAEELLRKGESLQESLREKESQLSLLHGVEDSERGTSRTSEIVEVEPLINKWTVAPSTSQVRSLRKVNNDQVAIAVNMDTDIGDRLEDEDDDKAHGFKSLTTSRIVPRFTRPVTDMIDGLWVSCDRALMRQPALRLTVIMYWVVMHALLAAFVV